MSLNDVECLSGLIVRYSPNDMMGRLKSICSLRSCVMVKSHTPKSAF